MDWSTIIAAVFAFVGTMIGSFVASNKTTALILYRLDELEKKQDKHNGIIERTYKLEKDIGTAFTKIDEMREDIKELKKEGK